MWKRSAIVYLIERTACKNSQNGEELQLFLTHLASFPAQNTNAAGNAAISEMESIDHWSYIEPDLWL